MDKAPDFGSGDCRFKSCHDRFLFGFEQRGKLLTQNNGLVNYFVKIILFRKYSCLKYVKMSLGCFV